MPGTLFIYFVIFLTIHIHYSSSGCSPAGYSFFLSWVSDSCIWANNNLIFHTKLKFFGLNLEKFCCVIRNWDRNFQISHYHLFTQILKQDNSIFRGLSGDFGPRLWPATLARDFGPRLWPATLAGDFGQRLWPATLAGDFGLRLWPATLVCDFGRRLWPATLAGDFGLRLWPATLARDFGRRLWPATLLRTQWRCVVDMLVEVVVSTLVVSTLSCSCYCCCCSAAFH